MKLDFAEDFFFTSGDDLLQYPVKQPESVYQALRSMDSGDWGTMTRKLFKLENLGVDIVLQWVRKNNRCTGNCSPVEVWIDPEGWFTVEVYER